MFLLKLINRRRHFPLAVTTAILVTLLSFASPASPANGRSFVSFSTTRVDFGDCASGNFCSASVTYTNVSGQNLDVAGAGYVSFSGPFGPTGSECVQTTPTGLLPGGSCTFFIDFAPPAPGKYTGRMCLSFLNTHPSTVCIKLLGVGL
jgi:hypothetical protein